MLSIFSCAYWPSVCLIWRNIYLGLLFIFWLGLLLLFLLLTCISYLIFWGTSILFSICQFTSHQQWAFLLLHILAKTFCFLSFWEYSSWQVWGDSSFWFWFAFPLWLLVLSIFSCAYWPSVCLLWENVYSDSLPIFKLGCLGRVWY